jgi:hypothetical protein
MNIRHKILEWFRLSRGVIVLHLVLMYYAIEIDSSIFLSGSFQSFFDPLGLSSMWIYHLYL